MRDTTTDDVSLDTLAVVTVCAGGDQPAGFLSKRDLDTIGNVTDATRRKAEAILDAVEARFGVRPQTVWGAGSLPEHNNRMCLDVMVTTPSGGWLGDSRARAWEIGDWVADLVWSQRAEWGLRHVMWRRRIRSTRVAPGQWRALADRGSFTANHEDHPHIAFLSDAWEPLSTPKPTPPATPKEDETMTPDQITSLAQQIGREVAAALLASPVGGDSPDRPASVGWGLYRLQSVLMRVEKVLVEVRDTLKART